MREIKFRAWHKERNCFIGFYSEGLYMYENGQIYSGSMNVTNRIELNQFTGLRDKNGVEIFEGDIVRATGSTGHMSSWPYGMEMKYATDHNFIVAKLGCGWVLRHISAYGDKGFNIPNCIINGWEIIDNYDMWNHQSGLVVIGNIYKNPELLVD